MSSVLGSLQQNQDHSAQILTGFQLIQQPKQSRLLMAKTQLAFETVQQTLIRSTCCSRCNGIPLRVVTKESRQLWLGQWLASDWWSLAPWMAAAVIPAASTEPQASRSNIDAMIPLAGKSTQRSSLLETSARECGISVAPRQSPSACLLNRNQPHSRIRRSMPPENEDRRYGQLTASKHAWNHHRLARTNSDRHQHVGP